MKRSNATPKAFGVPDGFHVSAHARGVRFLDIANAMSKTGRGGRRTLPYAFTEHGALQVANCSHLCASETR
jgi:hypothetical protein